MEVANLNIKVDVDGATASEAQLAAVGDEIDRVGTESEHSSRSLRLFSGTLKGLAMGGAAGGIGGLVGTASSLVAGLASIAGGAVVGAGGMIALAGGTAYFGSKALEAETHTKSLGEALAKLTGQGGALHDSFTKMQDAIAKMGPEVLKGVTGLGNTILKELTKFIGKLQSYIGPLLDEVGNLFSRWSSLFQKALDSISPATLVSWIDRLSGAFEGLFQALIPLAKGGMDALLTALEGLSKGLVSIVQAGAPLMHMIGEGFGKGFAQLGKSLGNIATAYGPAVKTLFAGLNVIFQQVSRGLVGLAPAFNQAFGTLPALLGKIDMRTVGQALGVLVKGFAALLPIAPPIINLIAGLVKSLAPFVPVISAVAKEFAAFVKAASPSIIHIFSGLVKAMMPLAKAILPTLKSVLPVVVSLLKQLAQSGVVESFAGLVKAVTPLLPMAGQLVKALQPLAQVVLGVVAAFAKLELTGLTAIFSAAAKAIPGILYSIILGLRAFVGVALGILGEFIHGAAAAFGWLPLGIGDALKGADQAFQDFKAHTNEALDSAAAHMKKVVDQANKVPATAKSIKRNWDAAAASIVDKTGQVNHELDGLSVRRQLYIDTHPLASTATKTGYVKHALDSLSIQQQLKIDSQSAKDATKNVTGTHDALNKLPKNTPANVDTNANQATGQINAAHRALDSLPPTKKVNIVVTTTMNKIVNTIKNLPIIGAQHGGWFGLRGPQMIVIGEHEPELVVPKSQMRAGATVPGGGGGGGVITGTLTITDWDKGIATISARTEDDVNRSQAAYRARMARMRR